MSVGKEWEIPLRQTKKFCPENCGTTKTPIRKNHYLRDMGPFLRYCHIFIVYDYYGLGLGGVLVVCGECYNLDRSVVVLSPHLSILFFKTPRLQGMSSLAL